MSDNLGYDEIIFKASHNSYERHESISEQLTFNPDTPYNDGCMGLELDIWRHTSDFGPGKPIKEDYFTVNHLTPGTKTLKYYLDRIKGWHDGDKKHYPVLITLDIKSKLGGYKDFHKAIDTYLSTYFGDDLIFKPGELIRDPNALLADNVVAYGWKPLSYLKGKFIFCLSGNKGWKIEYANNDIKARTCFSDYEDHKDMRKKYPNIVFFNTNKPADQPEYFLHQLRSWHFISRAYDMNNEENWKKAITLNFSIIATNKVRDHEWAKVTNDAPFSKKSGLPAPGTELKKSLKNKANNEYRTDKATQMSKDYSSPSCNFLLELQPGYPGNDIRAIRNEKNNEYFTCNISKMTKTVTSDCQRWKLIHISGNEYYIQNLKNQKYMTRKASQLSETKGDNEKYVLEDR